MQNSQKKRNSKMMMMLICYDSVFHLSILLPFFQFANHHVVVQTNNLIWIYSDNIAKKRATIKPHLIARSRRNWWKDWKRISLRCIESRNIDVVKSKSSLKCYFTVMNANVNIPWRNRIFFRFHEIIEISWKLYGQLENLIRVDDLFFEWNVWEIHGFNQTKKQKRKQIKAKAKRKKTKRHKKWSFRFC